ncbi:hypothetical protein [Bifidobacterium sp. SO1]|uniref:hypothetical protein n=1 Tax=Bifidobacterium sp. SO1 TaxID=2809029 RepID=UPI001BDD25AA|nr:hypothetical protein [Bifidobacterium sp. SO1]MBT1161704.1 hypothetical protein [Bifidobacterium sp. SO1]
MTTVRLKFTIIQGFTPLPEDAMMTRLGFRRDNRGLWERIMPAGPAAWHMSLHTEVRASDGAWGMILIDDDNGEPYEWVSQIPPIRERFRQDILSEAKRLRGHGLTGIRGMA